MSVVCRTVSTTIRQTTFHVYLDSVEGGGHGGVFLPSPFSTGWKWVPNIFLVIPCVVCVLTSPGLFSQVEGQKFYVSLRGLVGTTDDTRKSVMTREMVISRK